MRRHVPKVMHIQYGDGARLCGSVSASEENWAEEWMDDKKARTLPICPTCNSENKFYNTRQAVDTKLVVVKVKTEVTENNIPVEQHRFNKSYITLRRFLE
jgi:protein tyrosine/serine phosphatase